MTCTRFSLNSRNCSAPTRALSLDPALEDSVPHTLFICTPPCPISKYATEYRHLFFSTGQGRLNIIGGPGQSNALRPLLASGHANFNGKLNQTCRCICIVTTSVGSRNSVREGL